MLGILCGLQSEAKLARRIPGALVACAAARPGKARMLARELIDKGATKLMSFGVAGGLHPAFSVGGVVIGSHVASAKGLWACDAIWTDAMAQKLPQAQRGGIWGSETLIPTAADKAALHEKSRCLAVDMESQCIAEVAAEAGLPFAVLRTVCDTANMNVPPVVMAAIAEDGSIDVLRAVTHLIRRPRDIPDLLHVTRGINHALRALKHSLVAV